MCEEEDYPENEVDVDGPDVIGHGDDAVEYWSGSVGEAAERLDELLRLGDGAGYDKANWKEIFGSIPDLKRYSKNVSSYSKIEELLEDLPNIECDSDSWGGDEPGLSGCYYIFRVPQEQQLVVTDMLNRLISATESFLNGCASYSKLIQRREAEYAAIIRQREIEQREEESRREREVKERAEKEQLEIEKTARERAEAIEDFLANPTTPFFNSGMLLISQDSVLYWMRQVWSYRYLEEPEINQAICERIRSLCSGVVEVKEVVRPDVEMPHIPHFAGANRPFQVGWMHNKTDLEVIGTSQHRDPTLVRDDFLQWKGNSESGNS